VLANAAETTIFVPAHARAPRHFIELRGSRHAETEIHKLTAAVLQILAAAAPQFFAASRTAPPAGGPYEAVPGHRTT
jgi:thymidylate synthase (FAD)